ncbi:MAG: hypothetical protein K2X73_10395 [Sphingomonas sp.]|uniref:TonB-dependent receptor plug domain-containing protein n=1 Tax=Sphingomonas sp. TaxID=28214 RepID=UPI0025ED5F18|nr:TonB-dependent receptor plug domain-containing protein [Sphingomonas sp.]MBX9882369.1 hypothetical protein [Sphingomonas sp.]
MKLGSVSLLAVLCAGIVSARAAAAEGATAKASYPAAFFADVQPQNALDMLIRVPGFTLVEGNGARGFGDAAGNVLINGARPVTKDVALAEYLKRIPAATVDRIELLDGASAGLQGGGSRLIANIVLKASGGGSWRLRGETVGDSRVAPTGALSWKGAIAGASVSASVDGGVDTLMRLEGRERLINAGGAIVEDGPLVDNRRNQAVAGSFSIAGKIAGVTTTLSTALRTSEFTRRSQFDVFTIGQPELTRLDLESDTSRDRSAELSLELKCPIGRGEAKAIVLQTWSGSRFLSGIESRFPDEDFAASRFESKQTRSETILRAGWAPRWSKLSGEIAVEGVRTTLGAATAFFGTSPAGQSLLDQGTTDVGEWRGSAAISATYSGIKQLSIEAALAGEISRIELAAPFRGANTYRFLKPRLVLNWAAGARTSVNLRLERLVGQLDFGDFVGAQQVSDGSATQTNAALQPPQTDAARLTIERRWGKRGSVAVTLVGERARNIVDVIPVAGGQGIGNIPSGTAYGVDLLATLPLDFLLRGAELTVNAAWRRTMVTDPFNRQTRPFQNSEFDPSTISFRHVASRDITYGARFTYEPPSRTFRSALFSDYRPGPAVSVFGEFVVRKGLKLSLEVNRLFDQAVDRDLFRYAGVRGEVPFSVIESRRRMSRRLFALQIEGGF